MEAYYCNTITMGREEDKRMSYIIVILLHTYNNKKIRSGALNSVGRQTTRGIGHLARLTDLALSSHVISDYVVHNWGLKPIKYAFIPTTPCIARV